ncbi:glucokinase [Ramlibacter sp. 2FC]|uniref:glucokinase n=1 Tax=Ramlibacter sp. 2FC TaxID=2502188 RepID=UPI0010F6F875|nr:glucokinase [Ramlibacter sp. 2FC]
MNHFVPPGQPRLLADVGGTNARFAWQAGPGAPIEQQITLPCAGYATLEDALRDYLARCERPLPREGAIAIANPVDGDRVQMTNHHWSFSIAALQRALGFARLEVLNDFTALALALPALPPQALRQLGGGAARDQAAIALIGPGTGLGVSGLLPDGGGGWVPLRGEGGHVSLAPDNAREQQVVAALARRHGHASAERAVSGQGLVDIHRALCEADGLAPPEDWGAAEVSQAALAGSDARCVEALTMFCALLGSVAGNLALTLGAQGGVYLGGGIVPRLGPWFDRSPFRARFEAKGRFRAYLAAIPVFVIEAAQSPALLGAARALDA